jgi:hypothetical protein
MRRLQPLPVALVLGLLACTALARLSLAGPAAAPAKAKPDEASWMRRVRLVWRTHNWAGHSRAEQRTAEKAVLSEGKARAAAALRPMLGRPLEDPLRLQAAFTMALLDLDYMAGRDTLLRYLRALAVNRGHVEVDWHRLMKAVADPEAPSDTNLVIPEDVAGLVYEVYERRGDPKLLTGLLDLSPYTDGDLSEGLGAMLHDVVRKTPRALLIELRHQPQKVWQSVPSLIGFDLDSGVSVQRALPKLYQISRKKSDPLQLPAQRLLQGIAARQRQG